MAIITRIISALSSNILIQLLNVSIQLVGIPILLTYWGVSYYGEWLILFSIPSYIGMSDIGLGTVVTSEMAMLVSNNKQEEANELLNNAFGFILTLGLIPFCLFIGSLTLLPWRSLLGLNLIAQEDFSISFIILSIYVYLSLVLTLPLGYYRVIKKYARERYISAFFRGLEFFLFFLSVAKGGTVVMSSLVFLCTRIIYLSYVIFDLQNQTTNFKVKIIGFRFKSIRYLLYPSLSMMLYYLGQSLLIQGMTTIVGINLGPGKVVLFNVSRTLINFTKQIVGIINLSFWSEFSYAYGSKNSNLLRKIYSWQQNLNIMSTTVLILFLWIGGDQILSIWTKESIVNEHPFFDLCLISVLINGFWIGKMNMLMAINQHIKIVQYYFIVSIAVLIANSLLISEYGLTFTGISLITLETIIYIAILFETQILSDPYHNK